MGNGIRWANFSNKVLVGGIFAVLIFGLVGSQQAMAGNGPTGPPDIEIEKGASTEGSARSVFETVERETGFFEITATAVKDGTPLSVTVQDSFPAELEFISSFGDGEYNPVTGVWNVGTITEGGSKSLFIEFKVPIGTCGRDIVNTASLDPKSQDVDQNGDSNDSASATGIK